jgi:hypothetical protein
MALARRQQLADWIGRCQRELEDRLFQADDDYATAHGLTVTRTTGLFGVGGRAYRDPRFDQLQAQRSGALAKRALIAAQRTQASITPGLPGGHAGCSNGLG